METKSLAEKKSQSVYKALEDVAKAKEGQKRNIAQLLTYYALPIISVVVFIGIFLAGTIPSIQAITDNKNELNAKREEIEDLDKEIEDLKELRSIEYQMDADLAIIDSIVPSDKTQVAKFVGEIDLLAMLHNLEESSYQAEERIEKLEEQIEEQAETETAAIINIPTNSGYLANFDNIRDFLNALYHKNDFIVVSKLDMQGHKAREYIAARQREEGQQVTVDTSLSTLTWTMSVVFEKYQFSKGFAQHISENLVRVSSEPDSATLEYIRERYGDQEEEEYQFPTPP